MRQKLSKLNLKADKLGEQFDQVQQELASANQRLKLVNREASRYQARFNSMRAEVGKIAATAYKTGTGSLNSSAALLTSGNPQQILNQSSILVELSAANDTQIRQFVGAARQLTQAQQSARRARAAIVALSTNVRKRKQALQKLIGQQQTLLAQLTPAEQVGTGPGGGGSTKVVKYTGPTKTQAEKAVAFAYNQLGKPYVFGAAGPSSFDCSGLTMSAWAAAGISIPRVSYDQMSALPSVPTNALQPGDIVGFAGNSHVGIYVGNGMLIDAPHTGLDVEKVALSGWFKQELDGAVRP